MLEKFFRKIFFKIYSTIFPTFLAFRSEKLILKPFLKFFLLKSAKILAFFMNFRHIFNKNLKTRIPENPRGFYSNPTKTRKL